MNLSLDFSAPFPTPSLRPKHARSSEHIWRQFHEDNPHVWEAFERFALEAARSRQRFGARMIWERLRWYARIETTDRDAWKLNNNHAPFYARLFLGMHPEHAGLFETRERSG